MSYSRLWNTKVKSFVEGYVSSYSLAAVNQDITNSQRLIQENEVLETAIKTNTLFAINDNLVVNGGYQIFEVGITDLEDIDNPSFKRLVKKVNRYHVGFLEGDLNFHKTQLRAGVRSTWYSSDNLLFVEPRIAVSQEMGENFTLELLGEFKHQNSTQIIDLQTDFLGVEKRRSARSVITPTLG